MRPVILGLLAAAALAGPTMGAECQKALIPDEVAVSSDLMVNYALTKHVLSSTDQQTRKKWDGAFNAGSINGLFRSKTAQEFVQRVEAYTNESLGAVEVEQRLEREMSPGAWDAYTTCILSPNAILTAIPYKVEVLKAAPGYVVLPNSVTTSLNATTAYGQCIDWTATKATPEVSAKLVTWTVTSKPTGRSCPTNLVYALGFNEAKAKVSLIDRGDPYKVIQ